MNQLPSSKKSLKEIVSDALKRVVNRTTLMYTVMSLIICLVGINRPVNSRILNSSVFLWFALFSLLVSIACLITDFMKNKNVNAIIVGTVHFILTYAVFFIIFITGDLFKTYLVSSNATQNNPIFTGLMLTLIYIGAYIVVFAVKFIFMKIGDKISGRKEEYTKIYTDSEEK